MGWSELLSFCGFGTFFGGMTAFMLQRYIKKRDAARERETNEREERRRQERTETQQRINDVEAQNKATQLGVQALLRDRLLQAFKHYTQLGYADYDDRQNVLNMYKQYEALGPNEVMNNLYHRFEKLPLEK